jgi:hypothetical protein
MWCGRRGTARGRWGVRVDDRGWEDDRIGAEQAKGFGVEGDDEVAAELGGEGVVGGRGVKDLAFAQGIHAPRLEVGADGDVFLRAVAVRGERRAVLEDARIRVLLRLGEQCLAGAIGQRQRGAGQVLVVARADPGIMGHEERPQ